MSGFREVSLEDLRGLQRSVVSDAITLLATGTPGDFEASAVGWTHHGAFWMRERGGGRRFVGAVVVYVHEDDPIVSRMDSGELFSVTVLRPPYRNTLAGLTADAGPERRAESRGRLTPRVLGGTVAFEEAAATYACRTIYRQTAGGGDLDRGKAEEMYPPVPHTLMYIGEILRMDVYE